MKTRIETIMMIGLLALMPIVASAVEYKTMYHPAGYDRQWTTMLAEAPAAAFQSTSTLTGSGSAYTATPMLAEDGTATYDGASGPKRVLRAPGTPSTPGQGSAENQFPLGDGIIPLLIMLMAYATCIFLRRKMSRV